ncbi:hypothetical protein EXS70_05290 [Candidatus Peribacteria bacterium]|nr:hypothetical protein [Candidatus Peribacteria bacterium]
MTPLNWQEPSQKNNPSHLGLILRQSPSNKFGFILGIVGGAAVSLLLVGLVVGYVAGKSLIGGLAVGQAQPIAQVPNVPAAPAPTPPPVGPVPAIDPKTDRIRGDLSKAKVALIEYSDFECPFCQRHFPTTQQVVSTYGDKVAFVYRDFPLSFHPNAQKEAEAGRCIFELGGNKAFWKYHDYVFDKTTSGGTGFPLDQLPVAAKDAGVNVTKFQSCLDSGKYAKTVADEMDAGTFAGVSGTPGNIILDLKTQKSQLISGAVPFSSFKSAIDSILGDTAAAAPTNGGARTIKMTAELWKFTPNVIEAKQGEQITLEITSVSGTHGFSVPALGIKETVIQGNTVTVTLPTDKTGTFDFACSIQCGSGHNDMKGQIIIES